VAEAAKTHLDLSQPGTRQALHATTRPGRGPAPFDPKPPSEVAWSPVSQYPRNYHTFCTISGEALVGLLSRTSGERSVMVQARDAVGNVRQTPFMSPKEVEDQTLEPTLATLAAHVGRLTVAIRGMLVKEPQGEGKDATGYEEYPFEVRQFQFIPPSQVHGVGPIVDLANAPIIYAPPVNET
jgi:hypothetical protein